MTTVSEPVVPVGDDGRPVAGDGDAGADAPASPGGAGRTGEAVLTVGLLVAATAAGVAVRAAGTGLSSGDGICAGLLVAFAAGAAALLRHPPTVRLGRIVALGTGLGALRFVSASMAAEQVEPPLGLLLVEGLAAGLVLAVGLHLLLALPEGVLGDRVRTNLAVAGYAVGAVVGLVRFSDRPDPSLWPLALTAAVLVAVGFAAANRRYVVARGVVRQRLQWLGLAVALVVEVALVVGALRLLLAWPHHAAEVVAASLVLVPVAFAASASVRLVGRVERLLRHAVSLAGLSAVVVGVYLLIVVGLGRVPTDTERPILLLSMLAAAVAAVLFLPARERLGEVANRLVYNEPRDPTDALDTFGARMTRALPMDELLLQLAELLRKHLALVRAEVWTGAEGVLSRAVSVPDRGPGRITLGAKELPVVSRAGVSGRGWAAVWLPEVVATLGEGPIRVAPMAHAGELFGLLVLERVAGDDEFSEEDDRVLTELARQVGLALHNTELDTALQASLEELKAKAVELAESRARIVAAADAQRRAIERDLHDGAQQHLVALAVKLRLIHTLAQRDLDTALTMLEEARGDVQATVDEVRRLAHGIYPPLLMDKGLGEALRAAAGRAGLPTAVEVGGGVGRYPQAVEAAVYFCCLEALQNAGKHAGEGATATVTVAEDEGVLRFEVADDGAGFDAAAAAGGHGFVNMADRLGAIGGTVEVRSSPGEGTRIVGRIPLHVELPS